MVGGRGRGNTWGYPENLQEEQTQREEERGRGGWAEVRAGSRWLREAALGKGLLVGASAPRGRFGDTPRGLPAAPVAAGDVPAPRPGLRAGGDGQRCSALVAGPWLPCGCVPRLEELSSSSIRVPPWLPGHFVDRSQPCGTLRTPPPAPALARAAFHTRLRSCPALMPLFSPGLGGRALCPLQTPPGGTGAPLDAQAGP